MPVQSLVDFAAILMFQAESCSSRIQILIMTRNLSSISIYLSFSITWHFLLKIFFSKTSLSHEFHLQVNSTLMCTSQPLQLHRKMTYLHIIFSFDNFFIKNLFCFNRVQSFNAWHYIWRNFLWQTCSFFSDYYQQNFGSILENYLFNQLFVICDIDFNFGSIARLLELKWITKLLVVYFATCSIT